MSFHAYTKRQFKALNFDGSSYRFLKEADCGDVRARLDCKRWGSHCMFLYLTLSGGDKIFAPVYYGNDPEHRYLGFMDIPIGGIVEISIDAYVGEDKGFVCCAKWLPDETDPAKAESKNDGMSD